MFNPDSLPALMQIMLTFLSHDCPRDHKTVTLNNGIEADLNLYEIETCDAGTIGIWGYFPDFSNDPTNFILWEWYMK